MAFVLDDMVFFLAVQSLYAAMNSWCSNNFFSGSGIKLMPIPETANCTETSLTVASSANFWN